MSTIRRTSVLLPEGTVIFSIIDGMSYYEDEDRVAELKEVISALVYLANHIHGGHIFKLLTTSPLRSHTAAAFFHQDHIYNMDAKLSLNDGFTVME